MKNFIFATLFFLKSAMFLHAQVTSVVYNENFNAGTGGWTIGGFRPSWKYGIPSLTTIASNGTNCFATGDAGATAVDPFANCIFVIGPTTNGNFYNCCERSFVQSPPIDLTGVMSPMLSLDINLHCEQTYDGAKMQISFDAGATWQDIGTYTNSVYETFPSALNCREQNWYNKSAINYLSGTAGGCSAVNINFGGSNSGWSGGCAQSGLGDCTSPDVHGTNGWVTATHCISMAANMPSVTLRIVFGAGSQIYSDGIAFDNVKITDTFPVASFLAAPSGACGLEYSFTNTTDCGSTWQWDFDHSGSNNTSTLENPEHEFPGPGTYYVELTATDFCGGTNVYFDTVTVNPVSMINVDSIVGNQMLICNDSSGIITITFSTPGAPTPPVSVTYYLTQNNQHVPYQVTSAMSNPIILTGLHGGIYTEFHFTDALGCETEYIAYINLFPPWDGLTLTVIDDVHIQPGDSVQLSATANIPSTYAWYPATGLNNSYIQTPIATPLETTTYTVEASDTNGCEVDQQVTIYVEDKLPCDRYFFPNSFSPNGDGKNELFAVYPDPNMDLISYKMNIYNRWGQSVFNTNEIVKGWDGKNALSGIYVVVADFECENKKKSRYTGTLSLIR